MITETWLHPDGDDVPKEELSQDGYGFDDVPRPDRPGGGIALLYKNNLKVSRCPAKAFQFFECVEWKVCSNIISTSSAYIVLRIQKDIQ